MIALELRHARRALPDWLAGGAEVSPLAYRIVCVAYGFPPRRPRRLPDAGMVEVFRIVGIPDVIAHLCAQLEVDEYDVLLAFAELKSVGAFGVVAL